MLTELFGVANWHTCHAGDQQRCCFWALHVAQLPQEKLGKNSRCRRSSRDGHENNDDNENSPKLAKERYGGRWGN